MFPYSACVPPTFAVRLSPVAGLPIRSDAAPTTSDARTLRSRPSLARFVSAMAPSSVLLPRRDRICAEGLEAGVLSGVELPADVDGPYEVQTLFVGQCDALVLRVQRCVRVGEAAV